MKRVRALRMVLGASFALGLSGPLPMPASLVLVAANPQSPAQESDATKALEKVLQQMDAAAASFRTMQADFQWDQYQKVIDETDTQKGTVYYRRSGKDIEMLANITDPPKTVLFDNGKVQVYEPKLNRVTTYEAGKNREAVESFLVLGFGGGGHDMLKSFQVSYLDTEKIEGLDTVKLELIPKSERVRNLFGKIWLWIDPARGISVQQQFLDTLSGDYRLAKYSNIQVKKIPDSVFKLKTRSDTQFLAAPKG